MEEEEEAEEGERGWCDEEEATKEKEEVGR